MLLVHSSMSSDKCTQLRSHHHNQGIELCHHLQKFPFAPLLSTLHLTFSLWQLLICVWPHILPFWVCYINMCPGPLVFIYD